MRKRIGKFGVSVKSKRTYDGKVYMSKLECDYRKFLDILKKSKVLSERVVSIKEQVPFDIYVGGKKICRYLLDFEVEYADGRIEYVDVKGVKTDVYRIKKKLVEALFPIQIKEVKKGDF